MRSRAAVAIGLAAAAGAFSAAALISATAAPTARADEFTEILAGVQGSLAQGQIAFSQAFTDFSSGGSAVPEGLEYFVTGLNDDLLGPQEDVTVGEAEALTNTPIGSDAYFSVISPPSDLTDALSLAESFAAEGQSQLIGAVSQFDMGNTLTLYSTVSPVPSTHRPSP